jgi:hypothetical protein
MSIHAWYFVIPAVAEHKDYASRKRPARPQLRGQVAQDDGDWVLVRLAGGDGFISDPQLLWPKDRLSGALMFPDLHSWITYEPEPQPDAPPPGADELVRWDPAERWK